MGAAVGAIVANGTGYYYPPYIGYPVGAYPYYHPYATPTVTVRTGPLTTTRTQALMVCRRRLTVLTDQRLTPHNTIHTPGHTLAAPQPPLPTDVKASAKPTILIREPTAPLTRDLAQPRSGGNPTFSKGINPPTRNIIRPRTVREVRSRDHKVARASLHPLLRAIPTPEKIRAVICTLAMMVTFTRTPAPVGRNTTMEVGTASTPNKLSRKLKQSKQNFQQQHPDSHAYAQTACPVL